MQSVLLSRYKRLIISNLSYRHNFCPGDPRSRSELQAWALLSHAYALNESNVRVRLSIKSRLC